METTAVEKKSKKGLNFLKSVALLLTGVTIGIVTYKRYGNGNHTISGDFKALGNKIMPKRKSEPVVEQPVERPQQYGQNGNGNRFQNNGRFNSNSNNN